MKKFLFFVVAFALTGCSQNWNDLVHEEVPATFFYFDVVGQVKSDMNYGERRIEILLPYDADVSAVVIKRCEYTPQARCKPDLKAGDIIDLSSPITLTLRTYDDYVWTLSATLKPKPASEVYNMGFDLWSQDVFGFDVPYDSEAPSEDQAVWDSYNFACSFAQAPVIAPERDSVWESGEGKAAIKLTSRFISLLEDRFFPGCIFTGKLDDYYTDKASLGYRFNKRPATLDGYAWYQPKAIDHTADPYTHLADSTDKGYVFIALAKWDEQFAVSPLSAILDVDNVPGLIASGKVVFDREMGSYEKFSITLQYKSQETPNHVVIIASSSALGDYRTGADGSVLYLDELGFTY